MNRLLKKLKRSNRVDVINDDPNFRVHEKAASQIALTALNYLRYRNTRVNLVFTSDSKIKQLNRRFLKRNRPTDILAFPSTGEQRGRRPTDGHPVLLLCRVSVGRTPASTASKIFLGEIVISPKRAKIQAPIYESFFQEELARYICHGVLHLAGYRDKTGKEKAEMHRKEDKILNQSKRYVKRLI